MGSLPSEQPETDAGDRGHSQEDRRVILVPKDGGEVVVFGRELGAWAQTLDWAVPTAKFLFDLLGGDEKAGIQGRCFTIRPEDEPFYDRLKKTAAGEGYIYGSLRDDSGFAHAMAFQEVDGAPVSAPGTSSSLMLATAVQLAAIEQRLANIEEALEVVGANVGKIVKLLHRDHAAAAASAAVVLGEVTGNIRREDRLSAADWDRITGLEQTVRQRLLAVLDEMQEFRDRFELTGRIQDDRRIPRTLSADRWRQLVQQAYGLERAGLQWASAYAVKLQQDGEYDSVAVDRVHDWLEALAHRRDEIIADVVAMAQEAPRTRRRSNWELLWTKGVPAGRMRDDRDLRALASFREEVESGCRPYMEFDELSLPTLVLESHSL